MAQSQETDFQIKYVRIADAILDQAVEDQEKARQAGRGRGGVAGGRGGRSLASVPCVANLTGRGAPGGRGKYLRNENEEANSVAGGRGGPPSRGGRAPPARGAPGMRGGRGRGA